MSSRVWVGLCLLLSGNSFLSAADSITAVPVVQPSHAAGTKPAETPEKKAPSFQLQPGFQVELIYDVPKDQLGSWVNITCDPKGRLIVSDQGAKGLCRITPAPIGSKEPSKIEQLDIKIDGKLISAAQGLLYAFDSLYVCINGNGGSPGSGFYRLRDTNGDDQFDEAVLLKALQGGGEHGPHALRLSPDGKSIYILAGNHTQPPFEQKRIGEVQTMGGIRSAQLQAELPANVTSRIAPNWDEDLVLPRQWDGGGHAAGILAPGGWIAKTDPDGKTFEMVSVGFRNQFDMAFNADGELFAYDADMEWDLGSPWYRPTRVVHAVSGSEFGWRSGTGKWPRYYADSLPEVIDIGPGSPVGIDFGYGTKFPAKYQKALYICDWTFGTMYAIHMQPDGSTYKATKEEFVARTPLPLTDCIVGKDGALYFTIGGRGTQSALYRVTYTGSESTAPADARDAATQAARNARRDIEALHVAFDGKDAAAKVAKLVPYLANNERNLRYAARVALERIPTQEWIKTVTNSTDANTVIHGCIGLARVGNVSYQPTLINALLQLDYAKLSADQKLDYLRSMQLVITRLGMPQENDLKRLLDKLDPLFPSNAEFENRELVNLLVAIKSPTIVRKTIPLLDVAHKYSNSELQELILRNPQYGKTISSMMEKEPDRQQMSYVFALRNAKVGWNIPDRVAYFAWFNKAHGWSGGASYAKFLRNIDKEAFANCTLEEQQAIDKAGVRAPIPTKDLPKAKGPGRAYTVEELLKLSETKLTGRNYKNGQTMFSAARCVVCHRYSGEGGATGPDLTQLAGRFGAKDMLEAIIEPSKVISDQYKASVVETKDGKIHTGRIVNDNGKAIKIATDPEDGSKIVDVEKSNIESEQPSPVSIMPQDLLKSLNENEVLDLLAYLLSRGDRNHPMFANPPPAAPGKAAGKGKQK
jgi:putative heme-binding domain-containing protein